MRIFTFLLVSASLAGCSPPHRFVVSTDGEPLSAKLTLNGKESAMTKQGRTFIASRDLGDASGAIEVTYADGNVVRCPISYITNGEQEPHHFSIVERRCHGG